MKLDSAEYCDSDIAIVGMACRYPGNVKSPKQFLQFLLEGGNGIIETPPDRWDINAYYDPDKTKPNRMYVNRGGFINDIDQFDPLFFGISPKEAPHIDPQHRWLLEITQEALENAGIKSSTIRGSDTAVYIGQFMHDYEQILLDANAHKNMTSHTATGPSMTLTANRISYLFDFTGPSVTLDTACSSSLVALDLACKAILNGDSRMAIAGGVNILLRPELTMSICAASMLSPDGYCKSFDASANGYVRSEGAGVVVVKPLRDALEHGDPIIAVIKATAVNQDGQTLGITVPNGDAQKKLLAASFKKAGISPEQIQYAEAHGTGTAVGDPIEVNALGSLLGARDGQPCIIGSVKSNVGHMESAAGMAGLMKTVLAMNEGIIPGNLHFKAINPAIDLKKLHLEIADKAKSWPDTTDKPRRALVNSFGFGGTNSNVIVEQAPTPRRKICSQQPVVNNPKKLLPISAKSENALKDLVDSYIGFFQAITDRDANETDELLHNICYTASLRRDHYKYRLVVAADTVNDFIDSLGAWREGKAVTNVWTGMERPNPGGKICFVFSGMGTQWAGVGRELHDSEPVFKRALERCDAALAPLTGWSLIEAIFDTDKEAIHATNIAQPVIFATQVALAELLASWGITPNIVVGHSAGEVAASYVGGALSFEDAIQVIYHRSRLQHTTEGLGKMLAVGLAADKLPAYLEGWEDKVSIGAINSEDAITLSGDAQALEAIVGKLDENGIFARFLKVGVPYHSPVMDSLKPALIDSLQNIRPKNARLRLFSTVSAHETSEGDWSAEYWFHNVREPVNFKGAIENIAKCGVSAFVEIAPHAALASSLKSTLASRKIQPAVIPTLRREQNAITNLYETIAQLHINNILSPWETLYPQQGNVELLPNYAWQRASYWCEAEEVRHARLKNTGFLGAFEAARFPLLGGKLGSGHWLWQHQLDLNEFAYLRDHKVGNDIVYPGACYVEMGLSIAASLGEPDARPIILENLSFHRALYLDADRPLVIESSYDPAARRFSISAPDSSATDWVTHASGEIAVSSQAQNSGFLDLDALRASMTERMSKEDFYQHCRTLGLEYENHFMPLEFVLVNEDKALAEIFLSETTLKAQEDYFLHPVILDAALQTFFATVDIGYLPAGIQAVCYHRKPSGKCYSYYETLEASPARVLGNITICDEQGNILVEVFGIEVLAIQRKEHAGESNRAVTYDFEWREQSLDNAIAGGVSKGCWLIVGNGATISEPLKTVLEARGQEVHVIHSDSPDDPENVFQEFASRSSGIIYLCDIDTAPMEDIPADALCTACEEDAISAVKLVRALTNTDFQHPQKLFFVSRGAQIVLPEVDQNCGLAGAGTWGFARVLANEHPELQVALIDLSTGITSDETQGNISLLVDDILANNDEQEVAYRHGIRYVHRLERLNESRLKKHTHKIYRFAEGEAFKVVADEPEHKITFRKLKLPELAGNDVLIRSEYSTTFPSADKGFACTVTVGRVEKRGAGVSGLDDKDRVIHLSREPRQSHYVLNEKQVTVLAGSVNPVTAVLYAAPLMLAQAVFEQRLNLPAGSSVLIHKACTPFGYAALYTARKMGLQPFVTVESDSEAAFLASQGVANIFPCKSYDCVRKIKAALPPTGFDLVLSDWHGNVPRQVDSLIGDFGHLVKVNADEAPPPAWPGSKSISLHVISIAGFLDNLIQQTGGGIGFELDAAIGETGLPATHARLVNLEEYADLPLPLEDRHRQNPSQQSLPLQTPILDYSDTPRQGIEGIAEAYIDPSRTYLVTGGLGGLGQQIMLWLAEKGARSIVLVGRRKPDASAMVNIDQLISAGVCVKVMQGDVTLLCDVENIVSTIQASMPPLGGVIHSAGVLDDGVILQQTRDKIHKVFAPKIQGAWNLHLATRALPLELFVCFSSIASVVGWAGQSNYAYANAFMDSLAFYRRARGLPALTINWGPWADAGMAASLDERDKHRMQQAGMFALSTQQGLNSMATLLAHRVVQAGVFDVDWSLMSRQYAHPERKSLLRNLLKTGDNKDRRNFLQVFLNASSDVKESMLMKSVGETLAGVLGLESAEAIDVDGNVFDYGVNSLMAMELKNAIQNLIEQKLPTSLVMQNPSVRKIVAYILQLDFSGVASAPPTGTDDGVYVGLVPLTAEQKNFLSWLKINPQWAITNHYFDTGDSYDFEKLNQAVNHVCRHHDSLRARFYRTENGWEQRLIAHQDSQAVVELDWRHIKSRTELLPRLKDYAEEKSLAHRLDSDPLVRITGVHYGDEHRTIILFSLHHFSLDGYSIHILTGDILTAYQQLLKGKTVSLPPQTTPVRHWLAALSRLAGSEEVMQETQYWKCLPLADACSTPVDKPENLDKRYISTHARYQSALSENLSANIMRRLPKNRNIKSFDIFLAAFVVTVSEWKDCPAVAFGAVDNGRSLLAGNEDIDLSRTTGWLSILKVIFIDRPAGCSFAELVSHVSRQLANLPNGGANLELVSAYHEDSKVREEMLALPRPKIWINYSGNPLRNDSLGVRELEGYNWINRENQLPWHFLVSVNEVNGIVHVLWDYSTAVHNDATVEKLAKRFNQVLDEIVSSIEGSDTESKTGNKATEPTVC